MQQRPNVAHKPSLLVDPLQKMFVDLYYMYDEHKIVVLFFSILHMLSSFNTERF